MSAPTYENKVLTGDKLVTLVSLIKGELANKLSTTRLGQELDYYFGTHGITLHDDSNEETYETAINTDGIHSTVTLDGETIHDAGMDNGGFYAASDDTVGDKRYAAELNSEGINFNVYDTSGAEEEAIGSVSLQIEDDGTLDILGTVRLNDEQLATVEGIITGLGGDPTEGDNLIDAIYNIVRASNSDNHVITEDNVGSYISFNTAYNNTTNKVATMADIPDISGKQDALVFNTAYNASSNKVATMSDVSGKQDTLVFNTAYNASSNKVATMADIPSVSAFQTASDVQTAITTALSGITSFSFEIVQALPQSNISQTTIYLVLKSSGSSGNIYTEYAYVKTGTDAQTGNDIYGWETLGDTQADIATLTTAEVQTLWSNTPADPGL